MIKWLMTAVPLHLSAIALIIGLIVSALKILI